MLLQSLARDRTPSTRPDTFDAMQAQVEGLALRVADNKTGYFGVYLDKPGRPKPFKAER